MKKNILNPVIVTFPFLLLLASIILAACVPAIAVGDPLAPTPEVFIPLNPSPTPSNSDLPLSCQASNTKVYVDKAAGYCFTYPTRFTPNEPSSDKPLLQGPAIDTSGEVYASLKVEIVPFVVNKSLDQQVDEFIAGFTVIDPALFEHARVTVAGESAILVERYRVAADPAPVQMNWHIVFIEHGNNLYRLIYRPADVSEAKTDVEELFRVTTSSFTFLN